MTIRVPPDNLIDRILTIFGKERKIILPSTQAESSRNGVNPYVTLKAKKESFFESLVQVARHQPQK